MGHAVGKPRMHKCHYFFHKFVTLVSLKVPSGNAQNRWRAFCCCCCCCCFFLALLRHPTFPVHQIRYLHIPPLWSFFSPDPIAFPFLPLREKKARKNILHTPNTNREMHEFWVAFLANNWDFYHQKNCDYPFSKNFSNHLTKFWPQELDIQFPSFKKKKKPEGIHPLPAKTKQPTNRRKRRRRQHLTAPHQLFATSPPFCHLLLQRSRKWKWRERGKASHPWCPPP